MKLRLPDDPKKRFAVTMYLGAAVIAICFIAAVAIPIFSNPTFCNLCHANQSDVTSWQRSSHSKVTCYGCHIHIGIPNLLMEKVYAGVTGVYYSASGNYEEPVNAESAYSLELPSDVCERCHNMDTLNVTLTKGMIMNHKVHAESGVTCAICHNRVAHRTMSNEDPKGVDYSVGERKGHKYLEGISHEGCFRCHTNKESKLLEERSDWKAPTKCSLCHDKSWKMPVGHGPGFKATHGTFANQKGKPYCYKCHSKEEFCGECHDPSVL